MKAEFTIPGFTENFGRNKLPLNFYFAEFLEKNSNVCFPVKIGSFYDCFNGMIWHGGRVYHNNDDHTITLADIKHLVNDINESRIGVKLVCTNQLLEKKHLGDFYCNEVIDIIAKNTKLNSVMVYSDVLFDYLKERYPELKLGLSTTKEVKDAKSVNKELERYDYIVPSFLMNNDWEELSKVNNPDKLEILVNETCDPDCDARYWHYNIFSSANLNGGINVYVENQDMNCKFTKYKNIGLYEFLKRSPKAVTVDDLYTKYIDAGITKYKIVGRDYTPHRVLETYIYYFIKPEYRLDIYSKAYRNTGLINFIK